MEFGADVVTERQANGEARFRLEGFNASTFFDNVTAIGIRVGVGFSEDVRIAAFVHTHPDRLQGLSPDDIKIASRRAVPIAAFARNLNGEVFSFSPEKFIAAGRPESDFVYYNQQDFGF